MPPLPAPAPLTQHRQLTPESVGRWLGVDLRPDPLVLSDTGLARAVNVDLHSHPGTAQRRLGVTPLTQGLAGTVRYLARYQGRRYAVAGTTLYREGVSLLTGLSGNLRTTVQPFQPLNDPDTWVYLADHSGMRKVRANGKGPVVGWGVAAPTEAPVLAATGGAGLTGQVRVVYTYAVRAGTTLTLESNPSVERQITLDAQRVVVTVTASPDPQVTDIRLYRSIVGGSTPLFERLVPNVTQDVTLGLVPDTGLGAAAAFDNDPPPVAAWVCAHQGHLFLCDDLEHPDYLWWSKRWQPESWPRTNFVRLATPADPIQGAYPVAGNLGVLTRQSKYRIVGNATSGFVPQEALSSRGTMAPFAASVSEYGCHFLATDGWFLTDFLSQDTLLSAPVSPLFDPSRAAQPVQGYAPIDWAAAASARSAYDKGRLYTAWPTQDRTASRPLWVMSRETQAWHSYALGVEVTALLAEEDPDQLTIGTDSGEVLVLGLDPGDRGQALALELVSARRAGGNPAGRKQFYFLLTDIDTQGEPVSVELYLDERLRATLPITGTRARRRLRLPDRLQGYVWHVRVVSTGVKPVAVYGVMVLFEPMAML